MYLPNKENIKIITAPTSEIITLNDIKAHSRIYSYSFADDVSWSSTIAPGTYSAGAAAGTSVDITGTIPLVVIDSRTNAATGTVIIKIQESNDTTTWTDWYTFATITTANHNTFYEYEYTGTKQYIRAYYTVANANCSFGVTIEKKSPYNSEDTFLTDLISIVREEAERYTGRSFLTQTKELVLNEWPDEDFLYIPEPPLQSVTYIKYYETDGTLNETFTTSYYVVGNTDNRSYGKVILKYGESWPTDVLYPSEPIRVRYIAGYTSKALFMIHHRLIYQWMLAAINKLYHDRDLDINDISHTALDRDKLEWL